MSPNKGEKPKLGVGGFTSPLQNLNGLVKIKAYDNLVTDELPLMQCNLLPT